MRNWFVKLSVVPALGRDPYAAAGVVGKKDNGQRIKTISAGGYGYRSSPGRQQLPSGLPRARQLGKLRLLRIADHRRRPRETRRGCRLGDTMAFDKNLSRDIVRMLW